LPNRVVHGGASSVSIPVVQRFDVFLEQLQALVENLGEEREHCGRAIEQSLSDERVVNHFAESRDEGK
jgi:hypothetical protein